MADYTIEHYGDMIADRVRLEAYVEALRRTVRPGNVVLDIGAGTGIFALVAARLGARRVHAVEPSDAIEIGRACAEANGLADVVAFHQGRSFDLELAEPADVVVSDLRGVLPVHGESLRTIVDARRRLLRPGGTLIPARDDVLVALVASERAYERVVAPWRGEALGLDLSPAHRAATSRWGNALLKAEDLISPAGRCFVLDYGTVETTGVSGEVGLEVARDAEAHGLAVWFDAHVCEGVGYTTRPGAPRRIYGHAFFPWPEPAAVRAGDRVAVALRADAIGEGYEWRWRTRIAGTDGALRAVFDQTTLDGRPIAPERLRRRAATACPELTDEGRALHDALALFDGAHDLAAVASALHERHPERFASARDALDYAAESSARFGRLP